MAAEETHTLEQTLEKTDLGQVINENKKSILIAGLVVVVLIIAYSIYNYQSKKSYQDNLSQVYAFQVDTVDKYIKAKADDKGAMSDADFITKMTALPAHIKGQPTLIPSLFEAIDKLNKNNKTKEAISILEGWVDQFNKSSYNFFFVAMKLAPMYENAGQLDKASALTQKLISSSIKVSKAQNYLNLGRIQMLQGDNVKAKESFDFIIKNHGNTQAAKLAKLYLQQIK